MEYERVFVLEVRLVVFMRSFDDRNGIVVLWIANAIAGVTQVDSYAIFLSAVRFESKRLGSPVGNVTCKDGVEPLTFLVVSSAGSTVVLDLDIGYGWSFNDNVIICHGPIDRYVDQRSSVSVTAFFSTLDDYRRGFVFRKFAWKAVSLPREIIGVDVDRHVERGNRAPEVVLQGYDLGFRFVLLNIRRIRFNEP
ncbi:hypothetical protein ACFQHN_02600 [Natrialbaceae archaeon GCM10025896]